MKQLTCEMCGSTDLMKQDGVFVCQTCGCKYSVEEARKMMVEGTVDIQGTVKVDNSTFVQKYLKNARRAREKEDWEETEKYYNMVEQNDPDCIEAIFYSSYGKAKASLVDGDIYKRQAVFNVLRNCISVIDEHYQLGRVEENKQAIQAMSKDLSLMLCSNFVFTEWKNGYGVVTKTNKQETYNLFATLIAQFQESILNIAKVDDHPYLHESLILLYGVAIKTGNYNSDTLKNMMKSKQEKLENLRKVIIEKYWREHPEEKERLESQKKYLQEQISNLNNRIENLAESVQISSLENKVIDLKKEKDSLGLFKGKEKKALQMQIDNYEKEIIKIKEQKEKVAQPIVIQITPLESKIKEIDEELTKDR